MITHKYTEKPNSNEKKSRPIDNNYRRNCIRSIQISMKYFGCLLSDEMTPDEEIGTSQFIKSRPMFRKKYSNINVRYKMVKCYVYSVLLLYGVVEARVLKTMKNLLGNMHVFEGILMD